MYHIYHVEGIKIGCSTNPERRTKGLGFENFKILETHSDIKTAAKRELELQKEYGYVEKNVHTDYIQQYEFSKKGRENALGLGAKAQIEKGIGMFGYSKEERQKINQKAAPHGGLAQSKIERECPYCGKVGKGNGMFIHFRFCKKK